MISKEAGNLSHQVYPDTTLTQILDLSSLDLPKLLEDVRMLESHLKNEFSDISVRSSLDKDSFR